MEKEIRKGKMEYLSTQKRRRMVMENKQDYLCLKWGTLKEWDFHSKKAKNLIKEYSKIGFASGGRMLQEDTPRQKQIICELIDEGNFEKVFLDWDNKYVSKDKAKKYVIKYGVEKENKNNGKI